MGKNIFYFLLKNLKAHNYLLQDIHACTVYKYFDITTNFHILITIIVYLFLFVLFLGLFQVATVQHGNLILI